MGYSIDQIEPDKCKTDILNLRRENFPGWQDKKYTWFYQDNPCGPALCWLARSDKDNSVVGSTAVFPRRFLVKDKSQIGGITGDFGVSKKHRILGPAVMLQKAGILTCKENNLDFLYGYPNKGAELVQKRVGYKIIGHPVRLVKILTSRKYIDKNVKAGFISTVTSNVVDLVLRVFSKETFYHRNREFMVEEPASFDRRFDDLWKKNSITLPIIGERTEMFLKWRFTDCPFRDYKIFTLSRKSTKDILGYIVYYVSENRLYIADILTDSNTGIFNSLVSEFLLFHRNRGLEAMSFFFFGNKSFIQRFRKFGFFERIDSTCIAVYADPGNEMSACLINKDNWYFTEADNDN